MSASLTSIPLLGPKLQTMRAQLSLRSGKLAAGKRALELYVYTISQVANQHVDCLIR